MTLKSRENIAFYAGSFDPFTLGHLSIVRRAVALFDRVIVAVGVNESKRNTEGVNERLSAIRRATQTMSDSVSVMSYTGLTVDAARQVGATCLLRGVRNTADFEYENNLADVNRAISGLDTVLLVTEPSLRHISSSAVRELQHFGHDVSSFLPNNDDEK